MQKSHPLIVAVLLASVASRAEAAVLCVNPGGVGGCFAAIQDAMNAAGFGDSIEVEPGVYPGNLNVPETRQRIRGAGPGVTVIQGGVSTFYQRGNLELSGVTVTSENDIGVLADTETQVVLEDCVISGNSIGVYGFEPLRLSITGCSVSDNNGLGIFVVGDFQDTPPKVAISRSVISRNGGGGILIDSGGTQLRIEDSTVSENVDEGIEAESIDGPGRPSITIRRSTIASNGFGIVDSTPSDAHLRVRLQSSIVADSVLGPDISGAEMRLTSRGYNLLEAVDPAVTVRGRSSLDLIGVDPLLGPLQDNGGPTETQALAPGSPALEAIPRRGLCRQPDQRGAPRLPEPCDIGAYEAP